MTYPPNARPDAAVAARTKQHSYPTRPPGPPTAWESIPVFVRFAAWIVSILVLVYAAAVVIAIFGLLVVIVGGGLALGGAA